MTKEDTAYADTLNLLGTGAVLDLIDDAHLRLTLEDLRYEALASHLPPGPKVRCPKCPQPFSYGGPLDGEHFADLWAHLIARHGYDPRNAEDPAQRAWDHPLLEEAVSA